MNTYEAELRQKWNRIDFYDGGSLQLSVNHPLTWFVRYAAADQKSIVIISDIPADNIVSSQSIDASCNKRKDGKYAISFALVNSSQEDVFISMSSDIIEYSGNERSPSAALEKVLRRYAQWLKLLDHKRSALLGANAQKGLIAELAFLKDIVDRGMKPADAIAGWIGPDGGDQDFVYLNGWHEIKATGASSASITISSVEQLDSPPPGDLIVYRIDKCAPAQAGAITLYGAVHEVADKLHPNTTAVDELFLKLASVGYIDVQDYDRSHYVITAKQRYEVNDAFPKLRRSSLPTEIMNAEYQIDLPSIAAWSK